VNTDVFEPTLQKILNKKGTPQSLFPSASKQIDSVLGS
jgi:hypothetical protein